MTRYPLTSQDWQSVVDRLGGAEALGVSARSTGAFLRARVIANASDLLRLILAYCLDEGDLRSTATWASAVGSADVSNVALLYRLHQCGGWLTQLIGQVLTAAAPEASRGRSIRIVDATTLPQAGTAAKRRNQVWRIHGAFDLPSERFGCFELTDQHGGERLDRIPVVQGEIRIADRAYLQPDRMAAVLEDGADLLVRAGWRNARWLDAERGAGRPTGRVRRARDRRRDRPADLDRAQARPCARTALGRDQEVGTSRGSGAAQSTSAGTKRTQPGLAGNAGRG